MPKLNLCVYITRTITDTKTGKVVKQYRKRPSKSFVKAFMQILEAIMAHESSENGDIVIIKDTGNLDKNCSAGATPSNDWFSTEAPANSGTYGIQIGTGTTAPAIADYTIETQIAHGVGAGQMQYGACSVQSAGVSDSKMEMTITRAFVNSSGGSITVKETGLVISATQAAYRFLIIRDAVNDAVADGQTYTITYTLETTV